MKLSKTATEQLNQTISIAWGVSRGRDSYGYTTCTLRNNRGDKIAGCNGGGYDMRGTVVGNWIAATFADDLRKLKEQNMPEHSHWQPERARVCDGKCRKDYLEKHMANIVEDVLPPVDLPKLAEDCFECPMCKGGTRQSREGQTIQDGRSFSGLCFVDPT